MSETKTVNNSWRLEGLNARIISIVFLMLLAGVLTYGGYTVYRVFSDSWVAPINLSPDNDHVIKINIELTRQLTEMESMRADIDRCTDDIIATDMAIAQIKSLKTKLTSAMKWSADYQSDQSRMLKKVKKTLSKQKGLLDSLYATQADMAKESKQQLDAGLISKLEYQKEKQMVDHLKLSTSENQRSILELDMVEKKIDVELEAWRKGLEQVQSENSDSTMNGNIMPEVLEREEQRIHLELDLLKLEAERRALVAEKNIAEKSMKKMGAILEHIQNRPLYRAIKASTNIAFVPYSELENIQEKDAVIQCVLSIFHCQVVGKIMEILPGEVVTQDPWGELKRGQYVILDLVSNDAIKENILRVRRI